MSRFNLPKSKEHDFAAFIRKAIGVKENELVEVVTPQFDRENDFPDPKEAPIDFLSWSALFTCTVEQLKEMGCGCWDGRLMLFPKEWYDLIPKGFPVEDINGDIESFAPGETDDDIRFGFLAYGVAAVDGKEIE